MRRVPSDSSSTRNGRSAWAGFCPGEAKHSRRISLMKGGCRLPPEPSGAPVPQQLQLLHTMTAYF